MNDGFGLRESEHFYAPPPLVILEVDDPCDQLASVTLETILLESPQELRFVAYQVDNPPACDQKAILRFKEREVSLLPMGYHRFGKEMKPFPSEFVISSWRTEEFAEFPEGAWNDGFGRLQIKMIVQAMTGRCTRAARTGGRFSSEKCGFPAFVRVISPSHKYDVASSIPATIDIGDDIATVYSWSSRLSAPTSDRPGSIASAELRLVSKHRNAIAQLATILGSAVFGAVVSMWIGLIAPPQSTGEQPRTLDPDRKDEVGSLAAEVPPAGAETAREAVTPADAPPPVANEAPPGNTPEEKKQPPANQTPAPGAAELKQPEEPRTG